MVISTPVAGPEQPPRPFLEKRLRASVPLYVFRLGCARYGKFLQFQRLVNYTRLRRLRGYSVRNMDLMDFEQYGVHIDKLFSNENQKPKSQKNVA